jgi:hypothetical protein
LVDPKSLSGFLTARFILELRKWDRRSQHIDSHNTLPSMLFSPRANGPEATSSRFHAIHELGRDIGPKPRSGEPLDQMETADRDTDQERVVDDDEISQVPRCATVCQDQ